MARTPNSSAMRVMWKPLPGPKLFSTNRLSHTATSLSVAQYTQVKGSFPSAPTISSGGPKRPDLNGEAVATYFGLSTARTKARA